MSLHLKPQDVLVLLKLVAIGDRSWTYSSLARELGMSASEVHAAITRAQSARLYADVLGTVMHPNLLEFLVHGVRYAFPAQLGPPAWGIPTAHAAPPLNRMIVADEPLPPVWEVPDGTTQGIFVTPLYRSVPAAARRDPLLYELLACVDALRIGRVRERTAATEALRVRVLGVEAAV
ncbi:MAG: hypothetical protein EA383_14185 [Spirochaetaceae bacterium]|nr:MAG: hypothetical protein EA383_14185 [Spirochaetaceae bacterium]